VIARKDSDRVRLYSRPGNDLTKRFPLIVESLRANTKLLAAEAPRTSSIWPPSGHIFMFIGD